MAFDMALLEARGKQAKGDVLDELDLACLNPPTWSQPATAAGKAPRHWY